MKAIIIIPEDLGQRIPFNALYLAAKLRDEDHMVDLLDQNTSDIWRYMDPQKQSVFVVADSHHQYLNAREICDRAFERRTILFGTYPTVCHDQIDFLVHGWNHVVVGDADNIPATMVSRSYQRSKWSVGPTLNIDSIQPAWEYLDIKAYCDDRWVPICTERLALEGLKGYEKPRTRSISSVVREACELRVRYDFDSFIIGPLFYEKHRRLFEDEMGRLEYQWRIEKNE